jgi:hypothetical protein
MRRSVPSIPALPLLALIFVVSQGACGGGGRPRATPTGRARCPSRQASPTCRARTTVVGDGTPASCTSAAVVSAVAAGGVITFDCGPDPVTITLEETAKIFNDSGPEIVIDGGGLVTLSGGARRILYMNTCDKSRSGRRPTARTRTTRAHRAEPHLRRRQLARRDRGGRRRRRHLRARRPLQARELAVLPQRVRRRRGPTWGGRRARASASTRASRSTW